MSNLIFKAAKLAHIKHNGQMRKDKTTEYIMHPVNVAGKVLLWTTQQENNQFNYENMIAAAVLHDVLEDTNVTEEEITVATNADVTKLVVELTNASHDSKLPRAQRKAMDREKLTNASQEAKIIKMFDRIDNLEDMSYDDSFGMDYARESILLAEVIGDADPLVLAQLVSIALEVHGHNTHNWGKCIGCELEVPFIDNRHTRGPLSFKCKRHENEEEFENYPNDMKRGME